MLGCTKQIVDWIVSDPYIITTNALTLQLFIFTTPSMTELHSGTVGALNQKNNASYIILLKFEFEML